MARDVPFRRSLLIRLLALSALVSLCSVAATAWLAVRTTTGAIRHEQGQALADDARVYDALLGYAAVHHSWHGAGPTVRRLARQAGHRIILTTQDRAPVADSAPAHSPPPSLPAKATATIDPLAVDTALDPDAAPDRIDPRAVGPFRLTPKERKRLHRAAVDQAECLRGRTGLSVTVTTDPSGRPEIKYLGGSGRISPEKLDYICSSEEAVLDQPTGTEVGALDQLSTLVDACLKRQGAPPVTLGLHGQWAWMPDAAQKVSPAPARSRESGPVAVPGTGDPADDQTAASCIASGRHEQLTPYVAPPVLLFVSSAGATTRGGGFDLSRVNEIRIAAVTGLVLLVTVAVTALAGTRLVRPLHALTRAARRMRDGDVTARVRVGGGDEMATLAAAFNDMSARRQQLEEARRAMVSDVAHELRTPLSNIRGWLEAAEDGVAVADRSLVSSLLEEALLLQRVIDDLQDLAAADVGELRLGREPVDAADLLLQVATAHRSAADAAGVELSTEAGPGCTLDADPVRLRQAVSNLVSNALRHTPAGGEVAVRARREGDEVVIEVADTGTGISAEDLPRVFDRFWRAEKSRSRQTGGSGLGLAIVRKLAEAHGGTAHAASEPGTGSLFTLRLPASTTGATPDSDEARGPSGGPGPRDSSGSGSRSGGTHGR